MYRKLFNGIMPVILVILLVFFAAAGHAEDDEERMDAGGQWIYLLENGGATILANVEEHIGDLVIPDVLDGYAVRRIGDYAFLTNASITRVTIGNNVTDIGTEAFAGCGSLTDVTIPDSVTSIGDLAFAECGRLTSIILPNSVTSIGELAFAYGGLVSATIPASVTVIGENAFADGWELTMYVTEGSYAAQYAQEYGIDTVFTPPSAAASTPDDQVFPLIEGNTFTYTSGAGGWQTEIAISTDGSFTGTFHDMDMGDTDDAYPGGTMYECSFSGMFVVTGKIDPFTYELRLASLEIQGPADEERIVDGVRVISDSAYGIEGGEMFMLYSPGRETADLPEGFLEWICMPHAWEKAPETLPFYGLYNAEEDTGFFAETAE